jgi:ABC-2 type transport system ATP-binding protein
MSPFSQAPPTDPPGTFASFTTAPLSASLDSVGVPVVSFHLSAPAASSVNPATEPVLFGKIYDVAPSGSKTLVQRLVAPIRVGPSGNVVVTLPGIVHRYGAGDRMQLVLAATDQAYVGSRVPDALTITVDRAHPTALELPVISSSQEASGRR